MSEGSDGVRKGSGFPSEGLRIPPVWKSLVLLRSKKQYYSNCRFEATYIPFGGSSARAPTER